MTTKKIAATRLVKRVLLAGPATRGEGVVRFETPVYFERNGLAIHPAWSALGPDLPGRRPYVLSALPMGWRVGSFRTLEDAEGAFQALECLVDWRRIGPNGLRRYRESVRQEALAALEKFDADFLRVAPRRRAAREAL